MIEVTIPRTQNFCVWTWKSRSFIVRICKKYILLGVVRNLCPKVPIIGLTATSTAHVTEDVKKNLSIKTALVLKSPLNRPNLFYEVRQKPDKQDECLDFIGKSN